MITGGEPTLHADLPSFIIQVKAMGLKVKLDTNGGKPDTLRDLLESGMLDYVAMDIKAPLDKYHLVGFNSPEAIEESVKLLNASGLDHEFRTTCVKAIISEDDFPRMADLIGPDAKWYLQPFNPAKTLDPQYGSESTYSAAELDQIARNLHRDNTFVR